MCLLHVLGHGGHGQVFGTGRGDGTDFKVKVEVLFCIINIALLLRGILVKLVMYVAWGH